MKNFKMYALAISIFMAFELKAQDPITPPQPISFINCCEDLWRACMVSFNDSKYCDMEYFCCLDNSLGATNIPLSVWSEMKFDSANFSADLALWTVADANEQIRYVALGYRTVIVNVAISTSLLSGGGSATKLRIRIPNGGIAKKHHNTTGILKNFTILQPAQFAVLAGDSVITITRIPFGVYLIGAIELRGQIVIELQ